jgi:hypothetical protein
VGSAERTPRQGVAAGVAPPQADAAPASSPTVPGANSRSRGSGPRAHTSTLIPAPFANPTPPTEPGRPPEVEAAPPASHSKVLFRSGAPSRSRGAEVSELGDSRDAPVATPIVASQGTSELPVLETAASRRVPRRAIATIACALAIGSVALGVCSGALKRAHLAPTVEGSTAIESPASRASEEIPGLGAHRLIPMAQRETSAPRLPKHAPGKRPL